MDIQINGAELFYEIQGTGERTLLMLHGWGCDHSVFQFAAQVFASNMQVVSLDFPGHGSSGEPPSPWSVSDYAEQVYQLLQKLHISNCDVIAHSFGGRVALMLGANHPEVINRLILTGAAGIRKPSTPDGKKKSARYQRLKKMAIWLSIIPGFQKVSEKWLEVLRQKFGSRDYLVLSPSMRQTFIKVVNEDLTPLLPKIQSPTILIWGEEDEETPLWMGQIMAEIIPDAALIPFEGCGHFAFLQQPDRFIAIAKNFLLGGR